MSSQTSTGSEQHLDIDCHAWHQICPCRDLRPPGEIRGGFRVSGGQHMGRLKAMPPRLAAMPARLGPSLPTEQARDRYRASTQHWRAWYKSPRWRALRASVLLRDRFTCAMCGHLEGDTSKLVCDHIVPHRGDQERFWSESNLQVLCAPCHNSTKQRNERVERVGANRAG